MKWDCGETTNERLERLGTWHKAFAWFPVQVAPHDCRWLETVERRCDGGASWDFEYRAVQNVDETLMEAGDDQEQS